MHFSVFTSDGRNASSLVTSLSSTGVTAFFILQKYSVLRILCKYIMQKKEHQ